MSDADAELILAKHRASMLEIYIDALFIGAEARGGEIAEFMRSSHAAIRLKELREQAVQEVRTI